MRTAALIAMLLLSAVAGMFVVKLAGANGIFIPPAEVAYIRNDGTVYPSDTPIQKSGNVYVFDDDLYNYTLIVQLDNIVIDGAGFTLSSGNAKEGITLSNRNNVTLKNFNITGFSFVGIHVENSSNISVIQNTFSNNYYDMRFEYSSFSNISKNTLTNTGFNTGICLIHSDSITISENLMANTGTSIEIWDSSSNKISRNNMTNNQRGMLLSASTNIMYYHNNFIDNAVSITIINSDASGANFADNGKEGNYWSNYTGRDVNGDGIGEAPYFIHHRYEVNRDIDRYPLMVPFDIENNRVVLTPPEPFQTTAVIAPIASVAVIGVGLLVYFVKSKKRSQEP
jgi:parallel beta-helix repeat protein